MLTQVPQARKMLGNQCSNECSGHEDEDEEDFHLWANQGIQIWSSTLLSLREC